MTGVTLNFDASNVKVEEGFEAIPAGWYNCTVTKTERKPSSKNPQNSYLEVEHTIVDGPYAGRKLFNRINLWNADATAVDIAFKGAAGIAALQQAVGVFQCQSSTQLHGIPHKVKIKVRAAGPGGDGKHYEASNDIVKYASINADVGAAVGGEAPASGGGANPPWATGQQQPAPTQQGTPPAPTQQPPTVGAAPTGQQPWEQPGAAAGAPAGAGAPPWLAGQQQGAAPPPAAAAPPPSAPAPQPVPAGPMMLPAANGIAYEEYKKSGWTDEQLIAHGMMASPSAPAPVQSGQPAAAAPAPGGARPPWAT